MSSGLNYDIIDLNSKKRKEILMNLPNKLTLLRILMIPLFVALFYIPGLKDTDLNYFGLTVPLTFLIAAIVFAVASFTDFLDGNLARKYNLVTTFGKLMDPLADKMLVMSALLMAIELQLLPAFVAILIIAREFMVTGIRQLAVGEGKVIAASNLGKAKTVTQMIMILALFIFKVSRENGQMFFSYAEGQAPFGIIVDLLILLATLLTVISGVDYFMKNKHIIFASK